MCEPVSITMGVMAAASSLYSIKQQEAQAQYNADMQADNAQRNNKAVAENFLLQNRALNSQQMQDDDAAADAKMKAQLETQKALATARVGAGEAGLSGLSIDALFSDIQRAGLNNLSTIDANLESATTQRAFEQRVMRQNSNAAFTNLAAPFKGSGGGLGTALTVGTAGLQAYSASGGSFSMSKTPTTPTATVKSGAGGIGLKTPSTGYWSK